MLHGMLYLSDLFALCFGSVRLPLVPQDRIHCICQQDEKRKTPDQSDGVEEIGIPRARVNPEMMESRAQKRCIQQRG